ncbi:MAG: 50S ribosomal protein L4 [Bacteroidetes bacterium]|nr:MAG: 50S ribosomal protein L4 [Bacteroidota bacterium]MBL1145982.1 50S ribosomal protein L4 [Bacteroidota bacterium]MCB0803353.1 50S ribosomal protein L4 [Flavobacteriales bacterium]NOG58776.1 50S ribosomal protein L4 [Bacteroidota bacterium]
MELSVLNKNGKDSKKKVKLSDAIYGIEPNDHAIYLDVKQYLANKRQGTSKSKERAEVAGSTRKIKKQKGTGTARAGSIKSPVFRGGGTIFGPRPRNYSFKLNKKLKVLARCSALSYKAQNGMLKVVEDIEMETPKTKEFNEILKSLNSNDKKTLMVVSDLNNTLYLSSRNLKGAKVVSASDINTYDLMNSTSILVMEGALEKIEAILS